MNFCLPILKLNLNNILFDSLLKDSYENFLRNLFDYSSLINIKNEEGETLLHYASFYGMIDKYYALINMGANIEKTNLGNNLLHYASFSGKDNFLIVELIKSDISPIEENHKGQTSLHYCANEKIAHYFNVWCQRNNILVPSLLDYRKNNVAHIAKELNHNESFLYWIKNYPELEIK